MSHASCFETVTHEGSPEREPLREQASRTAASPAGSSYDCLNDCVSSLGVSTLLSGAVTSLGCLALPPACPVFVGASVGSIFGACDYACKELAPQS
jgi:hypothetical protein